METLITALITLTSGAIIGWFVCLHRVKSTFQETVQHVEAEKQRLTGTLEELRTSFANLQKEKSGIEGQLKDERSVRIESETRTSELTKSLAEQKRLLDSAESALKDTFKSLSSDALKDNNQSFLTLAKQLMDAQETKANSQLESSKQDIDKLVSPLNTVLKEYKEHIDSLESKRDQEYGSLKQHIESLTTASSRLDQQTLKLVTALKTPHVRGKWGQIQLRRVVEIAGMTEYCDFTEEESVQTDDGRLRPDMRISLPNNRSIVIDAKTVLDAYMESTDLESEEEIRAVYEQHVKQVRSRIQDLSTKKYWDQFSESPEFVVLFLPAESFLSAALSVDHELIQDAVQKKVILASPITLIALLMAVAYGWKQEKLTENAIKIQSIGQQLFERLSTFASHMAGLRKSLSTSVDNFNKSVSSLETRVLPAARKFLDLGVSTTKEIAELEPVDLALRDLASVEEILNSPASSAPELPEHIDKPLSVD